MLEILGRQRHVIATIAFVAKHPYVSAAAGVGLIWGACFLISLVRAWTGRMETFGQFGDTFGSINALFTGLALVGLLYTILLQNQQLRAQHQEIQQQLRASFRQSREQFLTVRLSAQVALLQTQEAANQLPLTGTPKERTLESQQRLAQLIDRRIRIELLGFDSQQGFDEEWSPSVEKEAWRCWLLG
jgi:hypothetical protein